jgi:hypothetical protein
MVNMPLLNVPFSIGNLSRKIKIMALLISFFAFSLIISSLEKYLSKTSVGT